MNQRRITIHEQWAKWCKVTDQKQIEWTINYLVKKKRISANEVTSHVELARFYSNLAADNLESAQLLMKEMKAAWSQKKIRDKSNGRKGYSFVMSKDVKTLLERLASNNYVPINAALEGMIRNNYQFREELRQKQKTKIENAKSQLARRNQQLVEELKTHQTYSDSLIDVHKKEIELLCGAIETLALERAQKHAVLEANGLVETALTKDQDGSALEIAETYLAKLNHSIRLELDKIRPIVKPRRLHADRS